MSYSRNFGMRSFENIVRDARFRTPVGSTILIGSPIMIDPAAPGFVKAATSAAPVGSGCGVAVYEHIIPAGVDPVLADLSAYPFTTVPANQYVQMVHGPGTKVWFKNTAAHTGYDGRVRLAGTLILGSVNISTLLPGDGLTPNGDGTYKKANGTTDAVWLTIEQVNAGQPTYWDGQTLSLGSVDARFEF
jgi:hypothetical protein